MRKVKVYKSTLWKAIRTHCIWCCGGPNSPESKAEVAECTSNHCSLYPYRFGRFVDESPPPPEKVYKR